MKPGNPRREGGKKGGTGGTDGTDGTDGRDGCDGNYEVGAYGMEWVHNREPELSRVTRSQDYKEKQKLDSESKQISNSPC